MTAHRWARFAAAAVAALLAVFSISWLVRPGPTSEIFGVSLSGAALAYGRVKGAEDLLAAAVLALALRRSDPRELRNALLAGLIVPIGDFLALFLSGAGSPQDYPIHVGFVVTMVACAVTLSRRA